VRTYQPEDDSASWIFWRWRDIFTPGSADLYLRRLYVLRTPWFGLLVNDIRKPDSDRWMHDHPWGFLSLLLRGSYREETPSGSRMVRWVNLKRATDLHRIVHVSRAMTLVLTTRKKRTWGFLTDHGWVGWREYLAEGVQ